MAGRPPLVSVNSLERIRPLPGLLYDFAYGLYNRPIFHQADREALDARVFDRGAKMIALRISENKPIVQ